MDVKIEVWNLFWKSLTEVVLSGLITVGGDITFFSGPLYTKKASTKTRYHTVPSDSVKLRVYPMEMDANNWNTWGNTIIERETIQTAENGGTLISSFFFKQEC